MRSSLRVHQVHAKFQRNIRIRVVTVIWNVKKPLNAIRITLITS